MPVSAGGLADARRASGRTLPAAAPTARVRRFTPGSFLPRVHSLRVHSFKVMRKADRLPYRLQQCRIGSRARRGSTSHAQNHQQPTASRLRSPAARPPANPLFILGGVTVAARLGIALYGDSSQAWAISNAGTVSSPSPSGYGIGLNGGGSVTNSGAAARIVAGGNRRSGPRKATRPRPSTGDHRRRRRRDPVGWRLTVSNATTAAAIIRRPEQRLCVRRLWHGLATRPTLPAPAPTPAA